MARELPGYVSGHCGRGNHCDHDDPALRCRGSYGSAKYPTDCHCPCHQQITPALFQMIR